jgi:hypothetical protein
MLDARRTASARAKAALFKAEAMTPDQYRTNLLA